MNKYRQLIEDPDVDNIWSFSNNPTSKLFAYMYECFDIDNNN